jgi:predicted ATPase
MITRVYIDNFRTFSNFEVQLDRVNLLIGDNGTGKSTFVDILHSVVGLVVMEEPIENAFPPLSRTRWDSRSTQKVELDICINDGRYQYFVEVSHNLKEETVTLQREIVKFDTKTIFLYEDGSVRLHNNEGKLGAEFLFRGTRSFLPQLLARPENTLLTRFINSLRGAWLLKLNPINMNAESRSEAETLNSDGSNFASWYRHLSQDQGDLSRLYKRLGKVLPGFRKLRTASTGKSGRQRELFAVFSYSDSELQYEIDFEELSDGERATIILYCLLMEAENGNEADGNLMTLLLDEPENYVGLQLIQPWLVELADATRNEGQLFVISHNPEVIDYLAADHALFFERPGGGPTRVRKDPFNRDLGLRASEQITQRMLDA